jgi:hypothetical protein
MVPVRIGGKIRPPVKIKDAKPVYPAIAKTANVSGSVTVEATIGPDGKVREYQPTLLNGVPVAVVIVVTVNFTR